MPTIEFMPEEREYGRIYDPPSPASDFIPEWYKASSRDMPEGVRIVSGAPFQTVKACMPVFDAMTAGYILTCQEDITVTIKEDGFVDLSWRSSKNVFVKIHGTEQKGKFKVPDEYYPDVFKFEQNWVIRTPEGYSTLFVTPFWRDDLPFYILPGVVDTDQHGTSVNFPFLLKQGWSGTIKYGTPLVQLIPFKREDWDSVVLESPDEDFLLNWKRAARSQKNAYKDHSRSVKSWK